MKHLLAILVIFHLHSASAQFYTGSRQDFGKNRVQYNQFLWKVQDFERFKVYYYTGEEELVEYTAKSFHRGMLDMEDFFDFKLDDHIDIMVYATRSKFIQSNVGLMAENSNDVGGVSKIVGSKVFIYYEGDHIQLNKQIRSALAEIMLKKMLFGGDWKDMIKANALSSFPEWYVNGFIAYMGNGWDTETESKVKDGFLIGRFDDFSHLEGEEAMYIGQAFWNYIEKTYGKAIIPNIIYVTRAARNLNRGFEAVLGKSVKELAISMSNWYKSRYYEELQNQKEKTGERIDFHYKKERNYYGLKASPDGKNIAYVENYWGHYRIVIQDIKTGKRKIIYRAESKIRREIDKTYPVLTWHPSGEALAFTHERRGELQFRIYTLNDRQTVKKTLAKMDKVLSMEYAQDGKKLLFSATNFGQTDLYLYSIAGNFSQKLTDDIWDDVDASFAENDQYVLFSSNRPNDTIQPEDIVIEPMQHDLDVFKVKLNDLDKHVCVLNRVTHTPFANERSPVSVGANKIAFRSDENGIYNRFLAEQDSAVSFIDTGIHYRYFYKTSPQTNLVTSLLEDNYMPREKQFISLIYQNFRYKMYQSSADEMDSSVLSDVSFKIQERLATKNKKSPLMVENKEIDTLSGEHTQIQVLNYQSDNPNYVKKTVVLSENGTVASKTSEETPYNPYAYQRPLEKLYKVNFARDYITMQLDNQFLNQTYQRYQGPGSVYFNPKLSLLNQISFSDAFENYRLVGGIRIPTNLNSWEFLINAQLLKKRLDHSVTFYRQSYITGSSDNYNVKQIVYLADYHLSYPLTETMSIRGDVNYRYDNRVTLSVDNTSLARPNEKYDLAGAKIAFVFDNSYTHQANIWEGCKAKVFAEYLNQFSPNKGMWNIGMDVRYSLKIVKNFIWVNRLAGATSLGQQKLLYYMGGVDNWVLRPKESFNQNITVDPSQNFAYQTIATPMRGFIQNTRNGNSFLLWNTELRMPVFAFLSKYPVRNQFLKNFQLIAFGDVGTAWTGPNPYSSKNYFNTQTIYDKPITILVQNAREPIIFAVGGGVRMKLFGYFLRFDLGWGVENFKIANKPKFQFSLAYDI